jgi:hypothetical protein
MSFCRHRPDFALVNYVARGGVWDVNSRHLYDSGLKLELDDVLKAVVAFPVAPGCAIFPARRADEPIEALRYLGLCHALKVEGLGRPTTPGKRPNEVQVLHDNIPQIHRGGLWPSSRHLVPVNRHCCTSLVGFARRRHHRGSGGEDMTKLGDRKRTAVRLMMSGLSAISPPVAGI